MTIGPLRLLQIGSLSAQGPGKIISPTSGTGGTFRFGFLAEFQIYVNQFPISRDHQFDGLTGRSFMKFF